jgi:NAD dependent epimerase/dehydratase family enzyme
MRRVVNAPDWTDVPKDAREALVGLMMRLILEHAQMAAPTKIEAGHDC